MKPRVPFRSFACYPSLIFVLTAAHLMGAAAPAQDVHLKLLSSGGMSKMGGYTPQRLSLSTDQPKGIVKLPANLAAPLFGTLQIGAAGASTAILVVLDEPDGLPSRLFVDANANGDLTDDPLPRWTSRPVKGSDGADYTQFSGSATVAVPLGGEQAMLNLPMYRFDKRDPARAALTGVLFYYADYAREGEVALGGKVYKALLADRMATGDFRGSKASSAGVLLFIDTNGNGKFETSTEAFDVRKPFNIAGQTYEIAGMTAGGESFRIAKSDKVVAERNAPVRNAPTLLAGKPATVFTAKTTDGADVNFPASFKGKIVMLDFWAMWCGPCIGELPGLTAAYHKFHTQGFEVLGISLDREGDGKKLAAFTQQRNMPWPQVFDGKYW